MPPNLKILPALLLAVSFFCSGKLLPAADLARINDLMQQLGWPDLSTATYGKVEDGNSVVRMHYSGQAFELSGNAWMLDEPEQLIVTATDLRMPKRDSSWKEVSLDDDLRKAIEFIGQEDFSDYQVNSVGGPLTLLAVGAYANGSKDLAEKLMRALESKSNDPRQLAMLSVCELGERRYLTALARFEESADMAGLRSEIDEILSQFPESWPHHRLIQMVAESLADQSSTSHDQLNAEARSVAEQLAAISDPELEMQVLQSVMHTNWAITGSGLDRSDQFSGSVCLELVNSGAEAIPILTQLIGVDGPTPLVFRWYGNELPNLTFGNNYSDNIDNYYQQMLRPLTVSEIARYLLNPIINQEGRQDNSEIDNRQIVRLATAFYEENANKDRGEILREMVASEDVTKRANAWQSLVSSDNEDDRKLAEELMLEQPVTIETVDYLKAYLSNGSTIDKEFLSAMVARLEELRNSKSFPDEYIDQDNGPDYAQRILENFQLNLKVFHSMVDSSQLDSVVADLAGGDVSAHGLAPLMLHTPGELFDKIMGHLVASDNNVVTNRLLSSLLFFLNYRSDEFSPENVVHAHADTWRKLLNGQDDPGQLQLTNNTAFTAAWFIEAVHNEAYMDYSNVLKLSFGGSKTMGALIAKAMKRVDGADPGSEVISSEAVDADEKAKIKDQLASVNDRQELDSLLSQWTVEQWLAVAEMLSAETELSAKFLQMRHKLQKVRADDDLKSRLSLPQAGSVLAHQSVTELVDSVIQEAKSNRPIKVTIFCPVVPEGVEIFASSSQVDQALAKSFNSTGPMLVCTTMQLTLEPDFMQKLGQTSSNDVLDLADTQQAGQLSEQFNKIIDSIFSADSDTYSGYYIEFTGIPKPSTNPENP